TAKHGAVDKSRASGGANSWRDANLTAFFSKTIPAVVTSHLGKDFKVSCLEVIHKRDVDIRNLIVGPPWPVDRLLAISR
ncbi:MAG TPA: hypothetical protein VFN39_11545, partial [Gemmatimonadaceae bacterium]|nr:hypothetical protein [Gemmatimonadaceae bacterium]